MTKTPITTTETYPPALHEESGCKVGWKHYATQAEARVAATIAIREAKRLEVLGYDWGYQSPGRIEERDGRWIVCVP